jgi:hypothetical protein
MSVILNEVINIYFTYRGGFTPSMSKRFKTSSMRNKTETKISIFLIVLLSALFCACSKNKRFRDVSIIRLSDVVGQYEVLNLSDYVDSIQYVLLETNDTVLISDIAQIAFENNHIIINDKYNACKIFNRSGDFLHSLGSRGQGPTEYIVLRSIQAIPETNAILMESTSGTYFLYGIDGTLLDKITFPRIQNEGNARKATYLASGTYVSDVFSYGEIHNKAVAYQATPVGYEIIKAYPNPIHVEKTLAGFSSHEEAVIYRFQDNVRTYKHINDTIFTVGQDLEMKTAFIFDFGKYRASPEWMFEMVANKELKYIWPLNILESSDHLFIEFFFGNHAPEAFEYIKRWSDGDEKAVTNYNVYALFNKQNGTLKLMNHPIKKTPGFKNDLDGGPVIWPHAISSNNELITFYEAEAFLAYYNTIKVPSPELTRIARTLKIDNNPVVIIAKLKR